MNQEEYERSRIGVVFGDNFENGPISIKAELHLNEKEAEKQYEHLKEILEDKLDIDWALVVRLKYTEGKQNALIESITKIKERPRFEAFDVKIHSDETYVYFSVKLKEEEEDKLKAQLQIIMENGLSDLFKEQDNYVQFNFEANYDFNQLLELVQNGERIGAAFLKQIKTELDLYLTKNFYQGVEKFVKNTDEESLESPPLALLKHFKMLDLDLRFRSTDELPEVIKNQAIFGEEFQTQAQEMVALPTNKTKRVNAIMDAAADSGSLHLTLLGVGALTIESKTPQLSKLLIKYGKLLAKYVGLSEFVPEA